MSPPRELRYRRYGGCLDGYDSANVRRVSRSDRAMRRHKMTRYIAPVFVAAVAAFTPSMVYAGRANADPASNAANLCGSDYRPLDENALYGANVYLSYNGSTDCVVTTKTQYVGQPTQTEAVIFMGTSNSGVHDIGNYSYYAGPVRLYAPHQCIRWGGAAMYEGSNSSEMLVSNPSHCG